MDTSHDEDIRPGHTRGDVVVGPREHERKNRFDDTVGDQREDHVAVNLDCVCAEVARRVLKTRINPEQVFGMCINN